MPVMLIRHGETFPRPTQHENIEATIVKAFVGLAASAHKSLRRRGTAIGHVLHTDAMPRCPPPGTRADTLRAVRRGLGHGAESHCAIARHMRSRSRVRRLSTPMPTGISSLRDATTGRRRDVAAPIAAPTAVPQTTASSRELLARRFAPCRPV